MNGTPGMNNWKSWHSLGLGILIVAVPVGAWFLSGDLSKGSALKVWWLFMAGFVAFLLISGHGIVGCWRGAFIDNRNVISLSRFQMVAWTILVLSAFGAAVLWNIRHDAANGDSSCLADMEKGCTPALPGTLWLLMGLSTASLVGSPLILNTKKKQPSDPTEKQRTFELLSQQGYDSNSLDSDGQLVVNTDPAHARWSDLFTGEETGNFARLDPARLQMFFFTLVALLSYGVLIGHRLGSSERLIADLPGLSEGLLALIGISHTGYLAAKASQNSQTASAATPGASQADRTTDDDLPALG